MVFQILVLLGSALFELIDIDLFSDLVASDPFRYLTYSTLFGLGIAIGRESEGVTNTLRRIALSICHGMLPVLALLALGFALALPFTGLEPLWETGNTTPLLLILVGLEILFVNAVFQDGETGPPYVRPVRLCVEAALLASLAFSGISAYSIGLRVAQYGFTPERVWAVVAVCITAGYSAGYSVAVLWRRDPWLGLIRRVNLSLSVAIGGIAIVTHTPALDPLAVSAASQALRLIEERVSIAEFDFAFLHFRLGKPGQEWLDGDGVDELCVVSIATFADSPRCVAGSPEEGWTRIGTFFRSEGPAPAEAELSETLRETGAQPEAPEPRRYSDVRIGQSVFRLSEVEGKR